MARIEIITQIINGNKFQTLNNNNSNSSNSSSSSSNNNNNNNNQQTAARVYVYNKQFIIAKPAL